MGKANMSKAKTAQVNARNTKKETALKAYVEFGTVRAACAKVKVSRVTFYRWVEDDADFGEKYEAAKADVGDKLEEEALKRAYDGDHTLIIFLLKGLKPEKYGERQKLEHSVKGPLVIVDASE